jgi:hypothetical protein
MITGRYLIIEFELVLYFDTQCITWDGIDQPMKLQGGVIKETTHYEDLYYDIMALASTVLQDDYDKTCEPEDLK